MDVGFRSHHGHALLEAESSVACPWPHVHGVRGGGRQRQVVQIEVRTLTLLWEDMEMEVNTITTSIAE